MILKIKLFLLFFLMSFPLSGLGTECDLRCQKGTFSFFKKNISEYQNNFLSRLNISQKKKVLDIKIMSIEGWNAPFTNKKTKIINIPPKYLVELYVRTKYFSILPEIFLDVVSSGDKEFINCYLWSLAKPINAKSKTTICKHDQTKEISTLISKKDRSEDHFIYFEEAIKFTLAHEYAHLLLNHFEQNEKSLFQLEYEADIFSLNNYDNEKMSISNMGALVVALTNNSDLKTYLSINPNIKKNKTHPSTSCRINNIIQNFSVNDIKKLLELDENKNDPEIALILKVLMSSTGTNDLKSFIQLIIDDVRLNLDKSKC